MYIITYEPNKLHRYEYQKGFGSFVSLDFGSNGLEKEFNFEDNDNPSIVVGLPKKKRINLKDLVKIKVRIRIQKMKMIMVFNL